MGYLGSRRRWMSELECVRVLPWCDARDGRGLRPNATQSPTKQNACSALVIRTQRPPLPRVVRFQSRVTYFPPTLFLLFLQLQVQGKRLGAIARRMLYLQARVTD